MINVVVVISDSRILIEMEGHSGYGKKGEDIVCAGISGVFQFLIVHLFNNLKREGTFSLSSGRGRIEFDSKKGDEVIVNSFLEYLRKVDKSYPNSLRIEVFVR
ncbi:MAG: ribosomal-processing cysteine protease Prp [Brevinematales bacterium]|nr:ribosomal-processing cysteine protease Prp [Brevinematales bacterium]